MIYAITYGFLSYALTRFLTQLRRRWWMVIIGLIISATMAFAGMFVAIFVRASLTSMVELEPSMDIIAWFALAGIAGGLWGVIAGYRKPISTH